MGRAGRLANVAAVSRRIVAVVIALVAALTLSSWDRSTSPMWSPRSTMPS